MILQSIRSDLLTFANKKIAQHSQRFFKTGKGEYGEGDKFLGIRVPLQRKIAIKYWEALTLNELKALITSPFHEERLTALFILRKKYEKTPRSGTSIPSGETIHPEEELVDFYLKHKSYINNWDLVDSSAPYILSPYLLTKPREESQKFLTNLANSKNLWDRRIAMMANSAFIRAQDFDLPLLIAKKLLMDKEDLIQKAVGWFLREIGNRNLKIEQDFLEKHAAVMPRTALRYAIEKFPKELRMHFLLAKPKILSRMHKLNK